MELETRKSGDGMYRIDVRGGEFIHKLGYSLPMDIDPSTFESAEITMGAKKGQTLYFIPYPAVLGFIKDVVVGPKTFDNADGSKVTKHYITIVLDSGGDDVKILMDFDSSVGKNFAKSFGNVDITKKVRLNAYNSLSSGKKGLSVKHPDEMGRLSWNEGTIVNWKYGREQLPEKEVKMVKGVPTDDYSAMNNALYEYFRQDVQLKYPKADQGAAQPAAPQVQMTVKAAGATLQSFLDANWTIEMMIRDGYAVAIQSPVAPAPVAPQAPVSVGYPAAPAHGQGQPAPVAQTPVAQTPVAQTPVAQTPVAPVAPVAPAAPGTEFMPTGTGDEPPF